MTPKQKAEELIEKYRLLKIDVYDSENGRYSLTNMFFDDAKVCAEIAVDEIINDIPMYLGNLNPKWYYWNQVKQELEKM